MNKVRRDVVLYELKRGNVRLALCLLFMPAGYALTKRDSA
jgi:hypothetical protein